MFGNQSFIFAKLNNFLVAKEGAAFRWVDFFHHLVTVDQRLDDVENDVSGIKSDYVSKTVTESQSLASPLDVKTSYSVDGIQVVGARNTGWTAATGTPLLGSFNANQSYTVGTTYAQIQRLLHRHNRRFPVLMSSNATIWAI